MMTAGSTESERSQHAARCRAEDDTRASCRIHSTDQQDRPAMNSVEFYVRNVLNTPEGETLVVGVPNNGEALVLGARFETKYEVSRDDVMNGTPNPVRLNSVAVDLVVEKIDVMRKEVQQVPHGMTAALSLSGTGLEHVAARETLARKRKRRKHAADEGKRRQRRQ